MNDLTVLQGRVFPLLASATARIEKSLAGGRCIAEVPHLQERCFQITGIARNAYHRHLRPEERRNLHILCDKLACELHPTHEGAEI